MIAPRTLATLFAFAILSPLFAQDSAWQHSVVIDQLTGHTADRFILTGEYLASPVTTPQAEAAARINAFGFSASPANDAPRLVLSCSDGKLIRKVGLVRGLSVAPVEMEARIDAVIDGGRKKTVSTKIAFNTERGIADDKIVYTAFELGNILTDVLRGKTVTLVARTDPSASPRMTGPTRQILMEFRMPSAAPILAVCGKDKSLRGVKP